ncbi:anthranilate synthase component I family protein [Aestuariivivens sediminis]|uniref:anthranilate synthase component I family protein n=1 Tax=Aestuariivivens sediminis TaxID=2913557 RepID=UPI001F5631C7|nr:anthranilate synthase component I family protein [Aestuariivivens sediminis]
MRTSRAIYVEKIDTFKNQLLVWAQQFSDVVWLDSNSYIQDYSSYDAVLAVEAFSVIDTNFHQAFDQLKAYHTHTKDWIFGFLTYDLKNDIEDVTSANFDALKFPDLYFFQPKRLFLIKGNTVEAHYLECIDDEVGDDVKAIKGINPLSKSTKVHGKEDIKIKLRIHKDAYFEKVNKMLGHIHRGDIYEANFCQEFYAEDTQINPLETYRKLNEISKPPFASFIKLGEKYVLSASPERYLKKDGGKVISQPIKGTAKRSDNLHEDALFNTALATDIKERSENIMIVDLVRNDLSKTAIKGSVKVEELCKVYTFNQVHQMISTVSAEVDPSTHPVDIIESTFPMGSMTGAPKISAMQIIEALEETRRGVYSGAIGYLTPIGNFDFNVVIRSILYNANNRYVSYSVGGAITSKSDPLKEYEECLVKAKAMRTVLEN